MRPLPEQLGPLAMPVLQRADGHSAIEGGLRQLAVVEADVAQDRLLQVLAAAEVMALQDVLDAAVKPLDHTIRLRSHRRRQAVFDAEIGAKPKSSREAGSDRQKPERSASHRVRSDARATASDVPAHRSETR